MTKGEFRGHTPEQHKELSAKGGSAKTTQLKGFAAIKASDPEKFKQMSSKGGKATWGKIKGTQ